MQLVVFFVQETALSILYIFQTRKFLRGRAALQEQSWSSPSGLNSGERTQSKEQKAVLWQLIFANTLIIALDITLLGIQCANLFHLQGAFKTCVYGIKLKLEFIILNRLISTIRQPASGVYLSHEPEHSAPSGSGNRDARENSLWHKKPSVDPTESDGVQLVETNGFRSNSAESQLPMYHGA